jgi:hypothetical protein
MQDQIENRVQFLQRELTQAYSNVLIMTENLKQANDHFSKLNGQFSEANQNLTEYKKAHPKPAEATP